MVMPATSLDGHDMAANPDAEVKGGGVTPPSFGRVWINQDLPWNQSAALQTAMQELTLGMKLLK